MQERRSFTPRVVLLGLAISLVAALAVALYIYVRYVRYDPVALRHVPPEVPIVVHLNVQQAVIYEPFRKHLLHLFEAGRKGPESRLLHLERKTTLELGVDAREVAFGFGPGDSWVVGVGGLFRRKEVVEGAARMLQDESVASDVLSHPTRLRLDSGVEFSVAEDGTLLLAQSEAMLRGALVRADRPAEGRRDDLITLEVRPSAAWEWGGGRTLQSLRGVVRAEGEKLVYTVDLFVAGPGWEEALKDAPLAFAEAPGELGATAQLLREARVSQSGPGEWKLEGTLSRRDFEELVARLALVVRTALDLPM